MLEEPLAMNGCTSDHPKALHNITPVDLAKLQQLYPGPTSTVNDIFFYNAWDVDGISVIYDLSCRFNHSCVPSTYHNFADDGSIGLWVSRDISAGEELTANYDDAHFMVMTAQERIVTTQSHWHFSCDCEACDGKKKRDASNHRRLLMRGIILALGISWNSGSTMNGYSTDWLPVYTSAVSVNGARSIPTMQPEHVSAYWLLLTRLLEKEKLIDYSLAYAYWMSARTFRELAKRPFPQRTYKKLYYLTLSARKTYNLFENNAVPHEADLKKDLEEYGSRMGYVEFVGQGEMD